MAISKERKNELIDQYQEWIGRSKVIILVEYTGLSMKDLDEVREKLRETGGEFHIVKNTLGQLAFQQAGLTLPENFFVGSTAVGFAFENAPSVAKTLADFAKASQIMNIKGGYLDKRPIDSAAVTALADLPPLPVMRAQLLGTILAPAGKLVRTLAEPGRQIAAVIKAYSEPETASAAA